MPTHAVGDIRPVIGRFGGDFDVVFQGDTERIGERLRTMLSMQIAHGRPPLQLGERAGDARRSSSARTM